MIEIQKMIEILERSYPEAECSLVFKNPFELLVATILSAQCTDARVNKVTPGLFKEFPSPQSMAEAPLKELEQKVQSTGFYRNKAKNIKGMARQLVDKYGGAVPTAMEDLHLLPGVGRKTANVVLGNAFHQPAGVVVDTHVKRLSFRLGLTKETHPEKIEKDLNKKVPKRYWTLLPHLFIAHGRALCQARKPQCQICPLVNLCPKKGLKSSQKK